MDLFFFMLFFGSAAAGVGILAVLAVVGLNSLMTTPQPDPPSSSNHDLDELRRTGAMARQMVDAIGDIYLLQTARLLQQTSPRGERESDDNEEE